MPAFFRDAGRSLNQNDGSAAARGFLLGEQESSVDIVSAQVAYKF